MNINKNNKTRVPIEDILLNLFSLTTSMEIPTFITYNRAIHFLRQEKMVFKSGHEP